MMQTYVFPKSIPQVLAHLQPTMSEKSHPILDPPQIPCPLENALESAVNFYPKVPKKPCSRSYSSGLMPLTTQGPESGRKS